MSVEPKELEGQHPEDDHHDPERPCRPLASVVRMYHPHRNVSQPKPLIAITTIPIRPVYTAEIGD